MNEHKYQQIDDFFGSLRRVMIATIWFRLILFTVLIVGYAGLLYTVLR